MILDVLFYILGAVTCIQVTYFLCFYHFLSHKKKTNSTHEELPISVVICAKNEAKNLPKLLPSIVDQVYTTFEIILINDGSTDATLELMESYRNKHSNIKIVNVMRNEAFWGSKKYALTLGIKSASYEHLVFTDADCQAKSNYWIREMSSCFSDEKSIVLGYGKYASKKTFVNVLIRFETLLTVLQYMTYAKLGAPYMGVGRNLAYRKSEFFKTKGFSTHMNVASGDDDLFIQEAATKTNTTYTIATDSHTISEPPLTFKAWFRQKRRHVSTSSYYKFKHKLFLGLFFLTKVMFYSLAVVLCFFNWTLAVPIALLYVVACWTVLGHTAKKLEEKNLIAYIPLLELSLLLFQFSIFITNIFSKPTHWK